MPDQPELRPQPGYLYPQDDLLRRFLRVHNFIYANDGLSPEQALEEFVKVLFLKIYDENRSGSRKSCSTQLDYIAIQALLEKAKVKFSTVFDKSDQLRLSEGTLEYVCKEIWSLSLTNASVDAKGLAFQKFISHCAKDSRGQFFTPKPVIDFCVSVISPRADELVIDPACGSGGFLVSSLAHMLETSPTAEAASIVRNSLSGYDISSSVARLARMRLLLETGQSANVHCVNAIDPIGVLSSSLPRVERVRLDEGYDVVLTNPPFGTTGKIIDPNVLSHFDLGHKCVSANGRYRKSSVISKSQTVEILFIERCLQLLKEGGRMGIVLPNGIFENATLAYVRSFIRQRARILAIVNLPHETFVPFGTAVKTSLLFLQKRTIGHESNRQVFFADVQKVGYQGNKLGTPIYRKDTLGNIETDELGRLVVDEDFSAIASRFHRHSNSESSSANGTFLCRIGEGGERWDSKFYDPRYRGLVQELKAKGAVRIGEIADVANERFRRNDSNGKISYVELSDVDVDFLEITKSRDYLVSDLPGRASFVIRGGDIVTSVAGNSVGTRKHATAMVAPAQEGYVCSNGFRVLRNFQIDPYFLLFFFRTELFLKQMFMYRTGAAIPSVSDFDFRHILVVLPQEETISRISRQVRRALRLRDEARCMLSAIESKFQPDSLIHETKS